MANPTIFISYAHMDDEQQFVRRLGYALHMLTKVFWDDRLQSGRWGQQLYDAIDECEFFIPVMTYNYPSREWCEIELEYALKKEKTIIPIKRYVNYQDERFQDLQFANFANDFNLGFQELTYYILGNRINAWEYLDRLSTQELFSELQEGRIPQEICYEFADWIVIEQIWKPAYERLFSDLNDVSIFDAKIPSDIPIALDLFKQNYDVNRTRDFSRWNEIQKLELHIDKFLSYIDSSITKRDDNELGKFVMSLISLAIKRYESSALSKRDFSKLFTIRTGVHYQTAASQLRLLIKLYARRSRYLY